MEESVHVAFADAGNSSKRSSLNNDNDELGNPLVIIYKLHEGNDDVVTQGLKSEPEDEYTRDHPNEAIFSYSNPPFGEGNDQSSEGDISMRTNPRSSQFTSLRFRWKHQSSYPLNNLMSSLNSRMQTRNRAKNHCSFSALLSQIELINIKEVLNDADWINSMQRNSTSLNEARSGIWSKAFRQNYHRHQVCVQEQDR